MIDWSDTEDEDTKQNQLLSNEELSDEEVTNKFLPVDPDFQKLRDELKTRARDILQRDSEVTEEED